MNPLYDDGREQPMVMIQPIVRPEQFPHGLRCMDCQVELKVGDPYSLRLDDIVSGVPVTEITCLDCALPD